MSTGSANDILYAHGFRLEESVAEDVFIMQLKSDAVSLINNDGDPEGSISANPASLTFDRTNGDLYLKASGVSTTGWVQLSTGGGAALTFNTASGSATSSGGEINFDNGTGIDMSATGDTLTVSIGSDVITTITTDSGTSTATLSTIAINGTHNVNTSATGNVITVAGDNAITLGDLSAIAAFSDAITCDTGDITLTTGNINLINTPDNNFESGSIWVGGDVFMHNVGVQDTFLGSAAGAGSIDTSAADNVGIGYQALNSIDTGAQNTSIGSESGLSVTSTDDNTSIGYRAMGSGTGAGTKNIAVGTQALYISTGDNSTAVGFNSLLNATSGTNQAFGYLSGDNISTGTGNLCLGESAGTTYDTENNNIVIGNAGTNSDANTIRIGTQGSGSLQQDSCFIAGIAGVTVAANETLVTIDTATGELGVGSATGTVASSFPTDGSTATPSAGALTIAGGTGITTSGAASTVTVTLDTPVTVPNGGTALTTITDGGIMLGSGVAAVTVTAQPTDGQLLIGFTGSDPVLATLASADASVTISNGNGTIDLSAGAAVPTTFTTDSGDATPSANVIKILGSHGLNTNGTSNIVDVEIDNAITLGDLSGIGAGSDALTCTTGDISIVSGNLNLATTADADNGVVEVNAVRFMHSFGTLNTFVGPTTGNFTLSGTNSVGVGNSALAALTTGLGNVVVGSTAGDAIADGGFNTAVGFAALTANVSGGDNVAVGDSTLAGCTAGSNTAVGKTALTAITSGSFNLALGASAGSSLATSDSDNICLMNTGTATDNNTIRIGTQGTGSGQQDSCFIAGIAGVTVAGNETVVTIDTATGELGVGAATGTVATSFPTDSGTATPSAGAVTFAGAGTVSTSATGATVTITGTGGGFTWTDVTGTSDSLVDQNGYVANNASLVTLTLPASPVLGETYKVIVRGAGFAKIAQNASQTVQLGSSVTTSGTGGSLTATAVGDALEIVCVADDVFFCQSVIGSWTVV